MKRWDAICREVNRPYFNLVGCGLTCFSYISLGSAYTYITKNQKSQVITYGKDGKPLNPYIEFDEVKMDSLTFDECLQGKTFKKEIYYSILSNFANI